MGFPFDLLSDADEKLCKLFDVMKMKNMYGRRCAASSAARSSSTATAVVRREWRGVKVPGHAQEVLEFVRSL